MRRMNEHAYRARLTWDGNGGEGTTSYAAYTRRHRIAIDGKPELAATADPAFRGEAGTHNPEDLFLAAVSSCHMLSYLALCAKAKIVVTSYDDEATGTLTLDRSGGGKFTEITLHPRVTVADPADAERAAELHQRAHELCFIASSVSAPIRVEPR
jgi:organic hydroperoxide reductase OsmC/OhrA